MVAFFVTAAISLGMPLFLIYAIYRCRKDLEQKIPEQEARAKERYREYVKRRRMPRPEVIQRKIEAQKRRKTKS